MNDAAFAELRREVQAIERPVPALFVYYVFLSLSGGPLFPLVLLVLYFRYHTLRYHFDDEGLSMRVGVLFRREMHVTYAKMQDIHLSRGLLERWLGIGTVRVQTAGAGAMGDLTVVGTRRAEAIRDYLYACMRGVRERGDAAETAAGSPGDAAALLGQIARELELTRAALAATPPRPEERQP